MGISLNTYRARIGLHNCVRCKGIGHVYEQQLLGLSILTEFCRLVFTAGICMKYILSILCLLIFIIDIFMINNNGHTSSRSNSILGSFEYHCNIVNLAQYRIVISCLIFCLLYISPVLLLNVFRKGFKNSLNELYSRLFHKKSKFGCIVNLYSIWLFALNLLLILLTIPNIVNPGPTAIDNLSVIYQNVQGFVNIRAKSPSPCFFTSKVLNFQGYIFHEKPDVVILNETWLNESVLASEIFPNNSYKVFRRDRSLKSHPLSKKDPSKFRISGGGVAIAFRSDLDVATTEFKLKDGVAMAEIISVVVTSVSGSKLCISTLYRVGTLGAENLHEVRNHLQSISSSKSISKHILVGDFNLPKTQWPDGTSPCTVETNFINMFDDLGMEQYINVPTHKSGNTLDLLLSNSLDLVTDINILPKDAVCSSDHFGMKFKIKLKSKRAKAIKRKIYNLKKANFKAINMELSRMNWDAIVRNCNSDTALERFDTIFTKICDKHIPKVTVKSSFQPPWFDSELDGICKAKNKVLGKFKKTNDPKYLEEVKALRKKFKKACTQKKMDNVMNSDDPALVKKKFWSFYKSTSNSCRVPETVNYNGKFRSVKGDVANLFNKFFADQFSTPSNYNIKLNFENDPLANIEFKQHTVFDLLRKLNANKAAGPDGFQAKLLKYCANGLAIPLSKLYTKFFKSGSLPNLWKLGNVVPVHKKGDKSSVENYRPISLTCLPMKVFEYCIKDLLMEKIGHKIDVNQHGFLPSKSCLTQLIPFSSNLALALNKSSQVDVIYFDFAKAFDSVNHDIILHKLKNQFGIDGLLLQFFKSYLQDREQKVVIDGCSSNTHPVVSGVPQGSILGPLLFLVFINDMHKAIGPGTDIALYADDTKIWREIILDQDQISLQKDIDNLYQWSTENKINFHPKKCKVLAVTNKRLKYEHSYTLNGTLLDCVESERDLGVLTNGRLNWNAHCEVLARKANQRLGFVRRTCHFIMSSQQRRVLYLSLIRSLFEHCSPVWAPQTSGALNMIDLVQKRAIKWILKEPFVSYSDSEYLRKQRSLDLLPMKSKFLFTDLVLFHKVVYGLVNINFPNYVIKLEPKDVLRPTRRTFSIAEGNDKLTFKCTIIPKVNSFKNSFFVRTTEAWNSLPLSIRVIKVPDLFSSSLKEHLWLLLGLKPD